MPRTSSQARKLSRGATRNASVDFTDDIGSSSLLTGTPLVVQVFGKSTLTLTNKAVNTASYIDKHTGATVAIGKAVQFTVAVPSSAKRGRYVIRVTPTTDDTNAEVQPYQVPFEVV